jgi:hypothetical protein
MAFVNLPPNLQDLFGGITDRIAKLETGPNQAMYTADAAQATASSAQGSAASASAQATAAYNASLSAAAQATSAQYTAGIAQTSANGKNTSNYYVSAPSAFSNNRNGTTPIAGDLWFVTDAGTGYVSAQYIYNAGSGWSVAPITNTVIANLDAGKITAGTITGIAYNNGTGTFYLDPSGNLTATSATIQGTIRGNNGYFTGTLTSSSGTIGGWTIGTSDFSSGTGAFMNASTGNIGGNTITAFSSILSYGSISTTSGAAIESAGYMRANGALYAAGHTTTGSAANGYVNSSTGLIARSTASSQRYKHDIVNLADVPELDPIALYELPVRAFRFNKDYLPESDDRADVLVPGFIAEEVDAIYPAAADYNDGQVETWNDRMLVPGLLALIQDLNNRVKELEAKLSNLQP